MEVILNVQLIIQVAVAITLIIVILIQNSEDGGLGSMGGSSGGAGMFSARGKANFMTRFTAILAIIFIVNSLFLAINVSHQSGSSLIKKIIEHETPSTINKEKTSDVPLADDIINTDANTKNTNDVKNNKLEKR